MPTSVICAWGHRESATPLADGGEAHIVPEGAYRAAAETRRDHRFYELGPDPPDFLARETVRVVSCATSRGPIFQFRVWPGEALRGDADRRAKRDEFLATLSHELRQALAPLENQGSACSSYRLTRQPGGDESGPSPSARVD